MSMNYYISQCSGCGQISEPKLVMVTGAANYKKVVDMLKNGMDMDTIKDHFCPSCGFYQETSNSCNCMTRIKNASTGVQH